MKKDALSFSPDKVILLTTMRGQYPGTPHYFDTPDEAAEFATEQSNQADPVTGWNEVTMPPEPATINNRKKYVVYVQPRKPWEPGTHKLR